MLIFLQKNHGTIPAVQADKAFLPQHMVRFVYRMHIDADALCKLAYRREGFPFLVLVCGDAQHNLVAKLHIKCLIAVKINFYIHLSPDSLFL